MKKRLLTVCLATLSCVSLFAWKTEASLSNSDNSQAIHLYSDGSCVITVPNGRGTGTYDIQGRKIFISWDNGTKQQGTCTEVEGKLKSVNIEGVTYSKRVIIKRR